MIHGLRVIGYELLGTGLQSDGAYYLIVFTHLSESPKTQVLLVVQVRDKSVWC